MEERPLTQVVEEGTPLPEAAPPRAIGGSRWRLSGGFVWLLACSLVVLLFFVLPLAALLLRTLASGALGTYLNNPVVVEALRLSLVTTLATLVLALVLGTPVAYLLARREFRGRELVDTLIDLPMVLPPAVAGIALLITFGRFTPIGAFFEGLGISIAFTTTAVVMAQLFVGAPFYIKAAKAGFQSVDTSLEQVSATLGVSGWLTFWRITVPLSWPALAGGAVMTWARALGEFGATIMFAGNFIGRTQTMPLAIYIALQSDLNASLVLATILVVISFAILLLFKLLLRRGLPVGGTRV